MSMMISMSLRANLHINNNNLSKFRKLSYKYLNKTDLSVNDILYCKAVKPVILCYVQFQIASNFVSMWHVKL